MIYQKKSRDAKHGLSHMSSLIPIDGSIGSLDDVQYELIVQTHRAYQERPFYLTWVV